MAPQYASALGKNANCQTLVSVTLASSEVPVMIGLRLFLPESWASDTTRLDCAKVPEEARFYRTKPEIALAEIDRVRRAGVRFGGILADAGYGLSAPVPAGTHRARSGLGSGHPLQAEGLSGRCCHDLPGRWPRATAQEPCT